VVNFYAHYEIDGDTSKHVLTLADYGLGQEFFLLAVQFRETVLFWILPNFGETFAKFALISH